MKLHIGKTTFRIHPVLPFLWLSSILLGSLSNLFLAFAALLLHECGHLLAAKWKNIKIEFIEITPYGGVISASELSCTSSLSGFLVAAAGPLFSFIGCFISLCLVRWNLASFLFAQQFFKSNLLLLLINILPVLPMDGGRMLRAILCRYIPFQRTTRWMTLGGYFIGTLLFLLAFLYACQGILVFAPAFAGLYMIYAASMEQKLGATYFATSLIERRQRLHDMECREIIDLAAGKNMPLSRILSMMHRNKIYRIHLVSDDGMDDESVVSETELWKAIMQETCITLGDVLKNRQA